MVKVKEDLTGRVFGRLTVIEQSTDYITSSGCKYASWRCVCECGNECCVTGANLKASRQVSCGCFNKEKTSQQFKKYNDYEICGSYVKMYTQKGDLFLVDTEDFDRIKDICWYKNVNGIIQGHKGDDRVTLARVIMNCTPKERVKFIGGANSYYDCRKANLELSTHTKIMNDVFHHKIFKTNTSGIQGVSLHKPTNKWRAYIKINGKQIHLGLFDDIEDAANARHLAEKEYYGKTMEERN